MFTVKIDTILNAENFQKGTKIFMRNTAVKIIPKPNKRYDRRNDRWDRNTRNDD